MPARRSPCAIVYLFVLAAFASGASKAETRYVATGSLSAAEAVQAAAADEQFVYAVENKVVGIDRGKRQVVFAELRDAR